MKNDSISIRQNFRRVLFSTVLLFIATYFFSQDGKTLFKQNCGVCHTTTQQKMVGPGLEGITTKRSEEWLIKWIKDSQALVKSGDATAVEAFETGGKVVMPPFAQLSDADVKSILSFVGSPEATAPVASAPVGEPTKVAPKSAPWSTGTKVFIGILLLTIVSAVIYLYVLKYNLRRLGYSFDTLPLKDRVAKYFEQNGRFLMFIGVIVLALVMKSCISELM